MVQDALCKCFGDRKPPKGQLQFLTDNGPEFIKNKLNENLRDWNFLIKNSSLSGPILKRKEQNLCSNCLYTIANEICRYNTLSLIYNLAILGYVYRHRYGKV